MFFSRAPDNFEHNIKCISRQLCITITELNNFSINQIPVYDFKTLLQKAMIYNKIYVTNNNEVLFVLIYSFFSWPFNCYRNMHLPHAERWTIFITQIEFSLMISARDWGLFWLAAPARDPMFMFCLFTCFGYFCIHHCYIPFLDF